MTGIGALLLALPGFITDAIGIALLLPPVQRWLAANMVVRTERSDGVIELEDGEWRRMPDRRIGPRPRPRPGPPALTPSGRSLFEDMRCVSHTAETSRGMSGERTM